ncbi:MAG: amidase [Thermoleophilaceae bacterium]
MNSDDLAFAGAARQAELIRSGELSSRELVETYLERIARLDPELNAFRVVMAERALADADQADSRRGAGDERPLLGVRVAIKDAAHVAGELTTQGTGAHSGVPAAEDSDAVRSLRGAGAVVIGKTNLPELAILGATESATWGVTRNPWDTDRTPGGSSGGAAAAVAAGLVSLGHATDGAGSIRIPASCCGLFGLKPQRGRVSLAPEGDHWYGLSVTGAVTRSVLDTALFLDAVSGGEGGSAPSRPFTEAVGTAPGRLRVAVSARPPMPARVSGDVHGALDSMAELLGSLGHRVDRNDPSYRDVGAAFLPRFLKGMEQEAAHVARPERLQRRTRGFARLGRLVPRAVLARALRDEPRHAARINAIFDDHDVLMTPVAARTPVRAAEWEGLGATHTLNSMGMVYPFTAVWNLTGQPAASVPAGFSANGLPLAVQLIGRPGDEHTLLSLAAQIEAERPWADRRPPI